MGSTPTTIPTITPPQFAARLAALFPNGWASSNAEQTGVVYAFLLSLSQGMTAINGQLQYALDAVYVPTETSPELDYASEDFYGDALPRPPGMSDAAFANLILSGLFQSAATRAAISNAITSLTGVPPRMIDPWSPGDTGALDTVSFLDVDTRANPSLVSGDERFTGFIVSVPPPGVAPLGGNPVPTLDDGLWIDVAGSFVGDLESSAISNLFALINRIRAYGVTIGVKIVTTVT